MCLTNDVGLFKCLKMLSFKKIMVIKVYVYLLMWSNLNYLCTHLNSYVYDLEFICVRLINNNNNAFHFLIYVG